MEGDVLQTGGKNLEVAGYWRKKDLRREGVTIHRTTSHENTRVLSGAGILIEKTKTAKMEVPTQKTLALQFKKYFYCVNCGSI